MLSKKFELSHPLQWMKCHCASENIFILVGGLYALTNAPSSHACSIARVDFRNEDIDWCTEQRQNRFFESSCICECFAVGGIPYNFKRSIAGIKRYNLEDGTCMEDTIAMPNVCSIASLRDDSFLVGTCGKESKLHLFHGSSEADQIVVGREAVKLKSIHGIANENFILVLQDSTDGKLTFSFERRDLDGNIIWKFESPNDALTSLPNDQVALYSNAGGKNRSLVEIIDLATGKMLERVPIATSIANLNHLIDDLVVFCDSKYRMCVYDLKSTRFVERVEFSNNIPGWLHFSVCHESRQLLACRTNNFSSPQTQIVGFNF